MKMDHKAKKYFKRSLFYLTVVIIIIWMVAPFLWLIITSISPKAELMKVPPNWVPTQITGRNYSALLGEKGAYVPEAATKYTSAVVNSSVVALSATIISLFVGSIAGYAFARLRFPGRSSIFLLILITQMIPVITLIVPLFLIWKWLGLLDTHICLIFTYCTFSLPFVIWVMRSIFTMIPVDLEDAARVDGCSRWGMLFRVIMPLALPGLAAVGMLVFMWSWGEFFYALIFTSTYAAKTVPVTVAEFSTRYGSDYGLIAAGGVFASIPAIVLVILFQRYIISGLTAGAVKG